MLTYMTCVPGAPGAPGRDGVKGDLGSPGKTGTQGPRGANGKKGAKGEPGIHVFCRTKRAARGQRRQWNATTCLTHELRKGCAWKKGHGKDSGLLYVSEQYPCVIIKKILLMDFSKQRIHPYNWPFAGFHSRSTKPPCWDEKVAAGQD